jgi:L-threonylcarbamoyladenylate synthase
LILVDSDSSHQHAAEIIARGGIIAFRTDTFYGLGADPFNASAVERIKQLKGREEQKPILVLISTHARLDRLIAKRSASFDRLTERFWPGALTIIGEAASEVPDDLTAGTKTLGVRLPDDDKVRALVEACGGAVTATSANPSGEPAAQTAADVEHYFGDALDLIVDGGPTKTDQPSTVVDAKGSEVRLIREGVIRWAEIQAALRRSEG